jgi:hypothetical protein
MNSTLQPINLSTSFSVCVLGSAVLWSKRAKSLGLGVAASTSPKLSRLEDRVEFASSSTCVRCVGAAVALSRVATDECQGNRPFAALELCERAAYRSEADARRECTNTLVSIGEDSGLVSSSAEPSSEEQSSPCESVL